MQTREKTACSHCGEMCTASTITVGEKAFCCQGCKWVHELFQENGLNTYYELEQQPGIKADKKYGSDHYAYLDDEEVKMKVLQFSDGEIGKVQLYIPSIHCSSCVWLLENLHRLNKGVLKSVVNFVRKELTITFNQKDLPLHRLAHLLASTGYAPEINLDSMHKKTTSSNNRDLYARLGVAGFAFGNMMLLSFPAYLDWQNTLEPSLQIFLSWLNFLLSLPVLLFSSIPFFSAAGKGLKYRYLNLDVPISLGIIVLFVRSLYEVYMQVGEGYFDSLAGLVFFLLAGKLFQQKTYDLLSFERDYKSYFPLSAIRVEDGSEKTVPVSRLQVGDAIKIRNKELIPADSILLSEHALIDYSFVTGESTPILKRKDSRLFAGGRALGVAIDARINRDVSQSYLTRLWNHDVFKKVELKAGVHSLSNTIATYFTWGIISIALLAAVFWLQYDVGLATNAFSAVLIVACPCALALSIPFTYGHAMRFLGRAGLFLKNADVVEKLARINHIIFDKTGTLTLKKGARPHFFPAEGMAVLSEFELQNIKSITSQSTHPLSFAIAASLENSQGRPVTSFSEHEGDGIEGFVSGCKIRLGRQAWICNNAASIMPEKSTVFLEIDDVVRGWFTIENSFRKGVQEVTEKLNGSFKLSLASGDSNAQEASLRSLLHLSTGTTPHMRFKQSPEDKLEYVEELQRRGDAVLMVGDGLNDAGALAKSDVGIAVSEEMSSFSPACDCILQAGNFEKFPDFLRFSKSAVKIVHACFALSLSYNCIGLAYAVTGTLSPVVAAILMPLSSITVVGFTTLATTLTARKMRLI